MVKSIFEINGKVGKTDIEIKGDTNKILLELSLLLMRIKIEDDDVYSDILKSMEIISNSIDSGIDVDELQNMFVCEYRKTLKKGE